MDIDLINALAGVPVGAAVMIALNSRTVRQHDEALEKLTEVVSEMRLDVQTLITQVADLRGKNNRV